MSRWLKLVLTWMLVLALPVQAWAAAAMAHCAGHQAGAASIAPVAAMASASAHPGAGRDAGTHLQGQHGRHVEPGTASAARATADEAGAATSAGPADTQQAQPQPPSSGGHHGHLVHGKCSACAACCGAVALPMAAWSWTAPVVAQDYRAQPVRSGAQHVPAGDERPPRPLTV